MKRLVIAALLLLTAALARAEQVEIVTYYPSPSATTDDLRVKRATVGSGYRALNLDDPLAAIPDGTLLVEQSVGIGAPVPFATTVDKTGKSPKNALLGNLDVNDIWVRSTQSWASQALAADVAPPKPYTFQLLIPPGLEVPIPANTSNQVAQYYVGVASYNIYTALQLWKSGVQPDQLRITSAKMLVWSGTIGGQGGGVYGICYWNPQECGSSNSNGPSWPVSFPVIRHGAVWTNGQQASQGTGLMEVTVDW